MLIPISTRKARLSAAKNGETMYKKIMVPVDLGHTEHLGKAFKTAADLSKHYGIPAVYVGVTAAVPGSLARTPQEFEAKLKALADAEASTHGHAAEAHMVVSHDPTADLDETLVRAVGEIGADLVVMQTHVPTLGDRLWPGHGGALASHADISVFLVR